MSKRSQSTSLPQAALQLTGVSLLSQFLYFLYQAALSHIVGTEGLGLVHMVLPIYYTLLAFLTSGFALAISKLCSEYQSRTQSRGLTVIVSNTLFLFLVTLLLVALLFWLAYRTFANRWLAELPLGGYVLVLPLLLCAGLTGCAARQGEVVNPAPVPPDVVNAPAPADNADKGTGSAKVNAELAKKRARMVADELINRYGISADRLSVDSKGSEVQPFTTNDWNRVVIMIAE